MTQPPLHEKAAVVTGAASGIGKATAKLLALRGAWVCCADIDEAGATKVADEITSDGGTAFARRVDVTDPAQNEAMVAAVIDRFGKLQLAHLNAGIPSPKQVLIPSMPIEDFDRVVRINLRGTFLGIRSCAPAIAAAGGGAVVLTSSVSGLRVAAPGTAAYVSSKHAIVGLGKVAAVDLGADGIRVNVICPGTVDTELFSARFGAPEERRAVLEQRSERVPVGHIGQPDDIAQLVAFLLSDDASYISGGVFAIDGGVTVMSGSLRTLPPRA
jgi:NAD(P)-dependent dehydrogenase (short-subunit alcohol dehydrogenase family)